MRLAVDEGDLFVESGELDLSVPIVAVQEAAADARECSAC